MKSRRRGGLMRQSFDDAAGLISLVSLGRRELFSLFVVFVVFVISKVGGTECAWLGWKGRRGSDHGVSLMPVLTRAAFLSVNRKRDKAREREEWREEDSGDWSMSWFSTHWHWVFFPFCSTRPFFAFYIWHFTQFFHVQTYQQPSPSLSHWDLFIFSSLFSSRDVGLDCGLCLCPPLAVRQVSGLKLAELRP